MVELELPYWTVRRLTYEDAKWYCSISRQPRLPVPLDDTANASHEVLPVAILSALVEAHRRMGPRARNPSARLASPADIRLCDLLRQFQLT